MANFNFGKPDFIVDRKRGGLLTKYHAIGDKVHFAATFLTEDEETCMINISGEIVNTYQLKLGWFVRLNDGSLIQIPE